MATEYLNSLVRFIQQTAKIECLSRKNYGIKLFKTILLF